jgi:hypothetical protein
LCNRCTQAVEREAPRLSSTAWTIGGAAGVVIAVALLVAAGPVGIFAGLAGGVVAGGVSYRGLRRRLVNTLRPRLASTVGELEPPARGPDEIDGTLGGPNNRPPGGFGPGV